MDVLLPMHWVLSAVASVLRLGAGRVGTPAEAPDQPLILYEFEGCPFCRIAREAVSEVGVSVIVKPCPKGGERFRPQVKALGGKAQFPYLQDPNTGAALYESSEIAAYLRRTYGGGRGRPVVHWFGPLNQMLSQLAVLVRLVAGTVRIKSAPNAVPLVLFGSERDPGARLVKERLCSMELDYAWTPARGAVRLADPVCGDEWTGAGAVRRALKERFGGEGG